MPAWEHVGGSLEKLREPESRMLPSRMLKRLMALVLAPALLFAASKRPLSLDDLYAIQAVSDPQCSPDGEWVAYSVSSIDREEDKNISSIWIVSWDGANMSARF